MEDKQGGEPVTESQPQSLEMSDTDLTEARGKAAKVASRQKELQKLIKEIKKAYEARQNRTKA